MLVFKYVVCSDLAPAAIGVVPIPISLLLIYPSYGSASVFPGSSLAASLSVLIVQGKSGVQQQVPIPHHPKYSALVSSISNAKVYAIINVSKTYPEAHVCIMHLKGSKFKRHIQTWTRRC